MKNFLLIIGVVGIFGVGLAVAVSQFEEKPLVRNGQEEAAAAMIEAVRLAARERATKGRGAEVPTAYCEHPNYNFGLMDPLTVGSHVFVIENRGAVPLVLEGGESSCKCTLSDLEQAVVAPGESYPVKLTWNSGHANQEFQQSAIVTTNDPTKAEMHLTVSGEVRAVIAAVPDYLKLDRLVPEMPASGQIVLYSQIWDIFEIDRIEATSATLNAHQIPTADSKVVVAFDSELKNATSVAAIQVDYDGHADVGPFSAKLRVYLRPPPEWSSASEMQANLDAGGQQAVQDVSQSEASKLPEITFPTQDDGTVLMELDVVGDVVRRLSLYSPVVKSHGLVDLGAIRAKESQGKEWIIVGRIRGEMAPDSIEAELTGIPGLTITAEMQSAEKARQTFRLTISVDEPMKPAIFDRTTAGQLRISAPGLPGNEVLEFPVNLDVLGD